MNRIIARLTATTALGVLTVFNVHAADDNKAYLDQSGTGNTALIQQTGSTNQAGSNGSLTVIRQQGTENDLHILQSGANNKAGIRNGGIDQLSAKNALDIEQAGDGNEVVSVGQFGSGSSGNVSNSLDITQTTDGNFVNKSAQSNRSAVTAPEQVNAIEITQDGGNGNSVEELDQDGSGNEMTLTQTGAGNAIGHVAQGSFPNIWRSTDGTVVATQIGDNNNINLISQEGTGNSASITQTGGDDNGDPLFAPWSAAGIVAGDNPLLQSVLTYFGLSYDGIAPASSIQVGDNNTVSYIATGSANQFGFFQDGNNQIANGVTSGSYNQAAVVQNGGGSSADFLQDGSNNSTGIFQDGTLNSATANADGNYNQLAIVQFDDGNSAIVDADGNRNIAVAAQVLGNDNEATIWLDGNDHIAAVIQGLGDNNVATIDVDGGSGNQLGVVQVGDSNTSTISADGSNNFAVTVQVFGGNNADVDITGSGNNFSPFQSFTGNAELASNASPTVGDLVPASIASEISSLPGAIPGLYSSVSGYNIVQPGLMVQIGTGNDLDVDITGDSNLFASLQYGDNNEIVHSVNELTAGPDLNQAAIVQIGNGNFSATSQTGSGNNIGVVQ